MTSATTIYGLALAVACTVMEGVGQVFFKVGSRGQRRTLWIGLGLAVFAVEALVYTLVLNWLEVSAAYAIGALSFVVVTLLSKLWLKETVDGTRWLGVTLIILGATLVAVRT